MPEQFDAQWLRLREPADHAARAASLLPPLQARLPTHRPVRIVDLGAGAGSNLRYLAPRLTGKQSWLMVDHDPGLLALAVNTENLPRGVVARPHIQDLSQWPLPLDEADLVTASALLDLVTDDWLRRLAESCAAAQLPALLALNYDGRVQLAPEHPLDSDVIEAVNAHQHGPKAMGQALGPGATEASHAYFSALGYEVRTQSSTWQLDGHQQALQGALMSGWHEAACAQQPSRRQDFNAWLEARLAMTDASVITVGHQDILALP